MSTNEEARHITFNAVNVKSVHYSNPNPHPYILKVSSNSNTANNPEVVQNNGNAVELDATSATLTFTREDSNNANPLVFRIDNISFEGTSMIITADVGDPETVIVTIILDDGPQ